MATRRVVVCEDDPATSHFLERAIARIPETEAVVCPTLGGALVEVQRHGASLLVMDHHTRGGNGSEGLRRLRSQSWGKNVPVLVFTGADVEEEARANGANDFLAKPATTDLFIMRVRRLLGIQPEMPGAAAPAANAARAAASLRATLGIPPPARKAAVTPTPTISASLQKKTILVIDDDRLFIEMYRAQLSFRRDIEMITASTGEEGLRKAASKRPDLILLDFELPDLRGDEVSRRLKADPATRKTPIAMVTSHSEKDSLGNAHYDIFLTKPVTGVKMRILLQKLLGEEQQ